MAARNANAEQARRWRELLMQFEIIRRRRADIAALYPKGEASPPPPPPPGPAPGSLHFSAASQSGLVTLLEDI